MIAILKNSADDRAVSSLPAGSKAKDCKRTSVEARTNSSSAWWATQPRSIRSCLKAWISWSACSASQSRSRRRTESSTPQTPSSTAGAGSSWAAGTSRSSPARAPLRARTSSASHGAFMLPVRPCFAVAPTSPERAPTPTRAWAPRLGPALRSARRARHAIVTEIMDARDIPVFLDKRIDVHADRRPQCAELHPAQRGR